MTNRVLDQNLLELLKSLSLRVKNLEAQRDAVRRNDIRLGKMVVATEPVKGAISLTNLDDKSVTYLGIPEPAIFSYSGDLVVTAGPRDYAPPHTVPKDCSAIEIVVSLREPSTSDTSLLIWFNNGQSMKTITLPAGEYSTVLGVNIPVGRNQTIYPQLSSVGTDAHELAVIVRFGYPRSPELSPDEDTA